jgi:hypothetical protein
MANVPNMEFNSDFLLHKLLERSKIYQSRRDLWWSADLKKWMCTNPALIIKIIEDARFGVHAYDFSKLEERFGLRFQHIKKIVSFLPLALDDGHKTARKNMAQVILGRHQECLLCFEKSLVSKLNLIDSVNGPIDLVQEVIQPSLKSALMLLSGLQGLEDFDTEALSQIFDASISIHKRIEINDQIAMLLKQLPESLSVDEKYFRISVFAIGYDSMLGSISSSLAMTLLGDQAKAIHEINWEKEMPYTGIPDIERVAKEDCEFGAVSIKSGQAVRLYLESAGFASHEKSKYASLFYGHGIHKCVAMHLSNDIWKIFINEFAKISRQFLISEINVRSNDYVFNVFSNIKLRFYD